MQNKTISYMKYSNIKIYCQNYDREISYFIYRVSMYAPPQLLVNLLNFFMRL